MHTVADLWNAIPEALRDPVALAIPVFLLALEASAAVALEEHET